MKKFILAVIVGGSLYSCTGGFEEMNTDKDNITANIATSEMLLPNTLSQLSDTQITGDFTLGSVVSQQITYLLYNSIDKYDWRADDRYWNYYNQLENINDIEKFGIRDGKLQYKGVALILKAFIFTQLTDAYGPVPFSQAGKSAEGVYKPKYDSQEEVYKGCLEMLKEANSILKAGGTIAGDALYKGDAIKWRKFANSLRMRMLLKMGNKISVQQEMSAIFNNPSEFPIFTSNADQAVYQYAGTGNQVSPYSVGRGRTYEILQLTALPVFFKSVLDKYQDPRLNDWFDKPVATPNGPHKASLSGTTNGDYANVSMLSISFFNNPTKFKAQYMSYSELEFILAEAAERGWISSSPKMHYDKAVTANFNFWGVQMPADYLTVKAAYTSPNLKLIAEQKYIALFGNGFEAWNDYKRNKLLDLKPAVNNFNDNKIPVRLQYPSIEQSVNIENYKTAVQQLGGDNINAKLWWHL